MEVINKPIGTEGSVKVDVVGGKIVLNAGLDTSGVDVGAKIVVEVDYFLDLLAAKIPGQLDDAVIAIMKSALKAI